MGKGEFYIQAIGIEGRSQTLISRLLSVWEASVRASHHFLTEADIVRLTPQAEEALRHIETLWVTGHGPPPYRLYGRAGAQDRDALPAS